MNSGRKLSGGIPGSGRERFRSQTTPCIWDGRELGSVGVEAFRVQPEGHCELAITHSIGAGAERVVLHWGVTYAPDGDWVCPPETLWPRGADTVSHGGKAAETELSSSALPLRIVVPAGSDIFSVRFVVKRVVNGTHEQWFNAGSGDFRIDCKAMDTSFARERVLKGEAQDGFGLYDRLCLVLDLLDAAQVDEQVMAWVYVVLRFHHLKQLRWYGKRGYQSKDIAHVQQVLSSRMAGAAVRAKNPRSRRLARMAMGFLARGGGMSEQIRLQVLDMMRRHGIREGHRPGLEDRFLEQWHQKLHQNTTPEDIVICESYLHFLHTGNPGDFWHALWHKGGISRERLATMPNPITADPLYLPQLIPDLKRYLWTLKTVHAGADLHFMIESGKWALEQVGDHEAIGWLYEIRDNFGAWWIPGRIARVRARLVRPMRQVYQAERDVLLLDAALDSAFKTAVERTDLPSLSGDPLIELVDLVLSQASLTRDFDPEYEGCLHQWRRQVKDQPSQPRWSEGWALQAQAAADRLVLILEEDARRLGELLQAKAEELGQAAQIPASYVVNFSEEVVRSQSAFLLSPLLQRLEPMLRQTAGLGRWNVVSMGSGNGSACGRAVFTASLEEVQHLNPEVPCVVVADRVSGTDDIPGWAAAVLASGSIDILSHVAIRARNQGVLLACCVAELLGELKSRFGEETALLAVSTGGSDGQVTVQKVEPDAVQSTVESKQNGRRKGGTDLRLEPVASEARSLRVVRPEGFKPGVVGGKSRNIGALASALPSWLSVPRSLALPLGAMEAVLGLAENAAVARTAEAQAAIAAAAFRAGDAGTVAAALARLRGELTSNLWMNDTLASALREILGEFRQSGTDLQSLWDAVRFVWASKWTDRAFLSRARSGVPDSGLCMGVLVQEVVAPEYGFVLHTAHPLCRDEPVMVGELVLGLGETLVGSHPGRPFSFSIPRASMGGSARVMSYPSKPTGLFVDVSPTGAAGLMVRSDSNGEDLEEFAGAGLYETVLCGSVREEWIDYAGCPLFNDAGFRADLMGKLRQAGLEVEKALGGHPQDIEGVIGKEGRVTIVQSRRQIV